VSQSLSSSLKKRDDRLKDLIDESSSLSGDSSTVEPLDPRAEKVHDELSSLVKSGLGVWRDILDSQDRLTKSIQELQQEMDEINELSALPVFRGGMPLLESGVNRVQQCKKRIVAVGNRLKKLDANFQAKKQKQKQFEAQRATKVPQKAPPEPE
jgi:hypothetical protein